MRCASTMSFPSASREDRPSASGQTTAIPSGCTTASLHSTANTSSQAGTSASD